MKVAYLMNTIDRFPLTMEVTDANTEKAGYPIHEVIINDNASTDQRIKDWAASIADTLTLQKENIGNPQSFNAMIAGSDADVFVIAGNDIMLPYNWLKEAMETMADPLVGIVGFDWRNTTTHSKYANLNLAPETYGTWVISRDTYNKVGKLNEWSKYGKWDTSYSIRCQQKGLLNGYVADHYSTHVGEDVGEDSDYRRMKDEELAKATEAFNKWIESEKVNTSRHLRRCGHED